MIESSLNADLDRFYALLRRQSLRYGMLRLADCNGRMDWPSRGVYFFFEPGEVRLDNTPRVVRVGTHAISGNSQTTLWNRLSQHRGPRSGVGNHRGSIFRLHVGTALIARNEAAFPSFSTWGSEGRPIAPEAIAAEQSVEKAVSQYIGQMPFVIFGINDLPGKNSLRAHIERNSIALLSSAILAGHETQSTQWLGRCCQNEIVRISGLWNVRHIHDKYDTSFLDQLESLTYL